MGEKMSLIQQLRGRAAFLRDKGRIKSPGLMEQAANALEAHLAQPAQAVDVPPEDLQIEVFPPDPGGMRIYRPRGVKVTHKPTGITVACDHERSQHANRDTALRALTAALPNANGKEG